MDSSVSLAPSFHLLISGLFCLVLGVLLRRRRDWMSSVLGFAGGTPVGEGELKWVPLSLAGIGVSWLIVFLGDCFPFPHGQRPFLVPLLNIVLLFASALTIAGLILWLILLRRLVRR